MRHILTVLVTPAIIASALVIPSMVVASPGSEHIPLLKLPVTLDGLPDEEVWEQAWRYSLAYEVRPGENTPAPVSTEVYVFHDTTHLYVAFRAFDPEPQRIRAHLSDRDDAWNDDWVGIVLDTFNDQRRDYLLLVNPLGVQMDEIEAYPNGGSVWDGIWDSAAQITSWGWAAELKIPFSSLRFQRSQDTQVWGFDAVRGYPRSVFRQMGAFVRDRNNNCYLCQAVKIEGFAGISPGKNLEIVPTLTAVSTDERSELPDGPYDLGGNDLEPGITARWGVTPNLTLAGTYNPDFSQVEADARQLDINEPFALFFPEKRPFFMEGADFFTTRLNTVYTRMMRDPSWGLKLTGKEGIHTVGAYVVQDEITNLVFPGSQSSDSTSLELDSTATVLRYKLDLDDRLTVGALLTNREGDEYSNRVASLDGDIRLTLKDRLFFQLSGSQTTYPDHVADEFDQPHGELEDWALDLLYTHSTRTYSTWALYREIGPDYRSDLGFRPQVDVTYAEVGADYTWIGSPDSWYSQLLLIGMAAHAEDHTGTLLKDELAIRFNYEGPLQSHAFVRPSRRREGWHGREYQLNELNTHLCFKPNGNSHFWFNWIVGDQVDYDNDRPGTRDQLSAGFWYRLGRHLSLEPSLTREDMSVDGGWLYDATVSQLTASWQLNARAFVRTIVQRVDYEYHWQIYHDEQEPEVQELFTQLLFSYKVNPRTVLFLGYSDNSEGTFRYSLTRRNHTLFAKIGYAWVQ